MSTIDHNIPPPKPKGKNMNQSLKQERTNPPVHETRTYETYSEEDVHVTETTPWIRPTSLEAPEPRKGFTQRWIRVGSMGHDDPTNTARKFREGWKPRPMESLPKGYHAPTISHGKWAGCIGVEGMILCEMPTTMLNKRNAHFQAKTDAVTNAIEQELQRQSHPNMPIMQDRSSKVVRNVKIAEDTD